MERKPDELLPDGGRKITFVLESRRDFVWVALTLQVDAASRLRVMDFYHGAFGVVRYCAGAGLGEMHSWESEAEAQGASAWSQHFTSILLDGPASALDAEKAIAAIMAHFDHLPRLRDRVLAAIAEPAATHTIDAELLPPLGAGVASE